MEENEVKVETQEPTQMDASYYIDAINKLKQNTVSVEEYNRVQNNNKQLVDALANGQKMEEPKETKPGLSTDEIRQQLFHNENLTNMQFCQLTAMLRERVMQEEGKDIFVPRNKQMTPSYEDLSEANKLGELINSSIEVSEGDAESFRNEFNRHIVDVAIPRKSVR